MKIANNLQTNILCGLKNILSAPIKRHFLNPLYKKKKICEHRGLTFIQTSDKQHVHILFKLVRHLIVAQILINLKASMLTHTNSGTVKL